MKLGKLSKIPARGDIYLYIQYAKLPTGAGTLHCSAGSCGYRAVQPGLDRTLSTWTGLSTEASGQFLGRWVEISAWTENIRIFKLTPYFLFNIQTRCGPGPRRVLCLRTHAESDKSTNILPHCRTKYNSGLEIFLRPNMENWEKLKTNSNSICFLLQPSDLYFPVDGLRQSFVKNCHKIYGWADFLLCNKTWRLVAKTCNL